MVTKRVALSSTDEAMSLFGVLDSNINAIEQKYSVQIFIRHANGGGSHWPTLMIRGTAGKVDKAYADVQQMREEIRGQNRTHSEKKVIISSNNEMPADKEVVYVTISGKAVRPRSLHQKQYIETIQKEAMVIAIGPAGTGKTFLAVASALSALKKGIVSRIVLTRPVVEVGEKLGYLPGDFNEKINPYMRPIFDAFYIMLGTERFMMLKESETIEIVPIAYMRGRTLENAFVILDEAQNTTPEQMKMFLTRMGEDSRVVITGDITQIDLQKKQKSGLVLIKDILKNIPEIRFCFFTEEDVVRHNLVRKIISAYERWENNER